MDNSLVYLTYALEIILGTINIKQISEATKMKALRKLINKIRRDHIKNEDIGNWCKMQSVNEWIVVRINEWN